MPVALELKQKSQDCISLVQIRLDAYACLLASHPFLGIVWRVTRTRVNECHPAQTLNFLATPIWSEEENA